MSDKAETTGKEVTEETKVKKEGTPEVDGAHAMETPTGTEETKMSVAELCIFWRNCSKS